MKKVFILEDEDKVLDTDLCRPLNILGTIKLIGKFIVNNSQWIPIYEVLGPAWMGDTLGNIKKEMADHNSEFEYEIIRGQVPP
jgi:hypothetical protein